VTTWGPLAEPFHDTDDERAPWRENAFLSFFDEEHGVCGAVHVSTSPNVGGRARASVVVDGRLAEVVEPLGPWTFTGESIEFDVDGAVRVRADAMSLDLLATPRHVPADYTALDLIPPLPGHPPLTHCQQGADVTGSVTVEDRRVDIEARGFRDRTWGFRDESLMFVEYLALGACFDDWDLTLTKFLEPDGGTRVGGYCLGASAVPVTSAEITRSASGLLAALDVVVDGSDPLTLRAGSSVGFWAPMGVERRGPTLAAYEECVALDGGAAGRGTAVAEHGILRRLS